MNMKKTLIVKIPCTLPSEVERFIGDARVYDSSCNSQAKVYFIDKEDGYYLKVSPCHTLAQERVMTEYFHSKGIGAEVVNYITSERDYLLTKRVVGDDCTLEKYLSDPKRLSISLGEGLRNLHELDFSDCPVKNKMEEYFSTCEKNYFNGNYDKSHFPDSYGYQNEREAFAVFQYGKKELNGKVLLHGDYCLPNVILDDWRLSGFIDVGNGGVGDRHIDLFWGIWSLGYNIKSDKYREIFLDAYGRDNVNEDLLKVVASIEVFG